MSPGFLTRGKVKSHKRSVAALKVDIRLIDSEVGRICVNLTSPEPFRLTEQSCTHLPHVDRPFLLAVGQ